METFSQELEDSQLLLSGPGFEPCSFPKSSLTVAGCSDDIGLQCPISETSEQPASPDGEEELTFFQQEFHVSQRRSQENEKDAAMTVGSGRQCSMLLDVSSRLGCCSKILLESSHWTSSEEYCYVWQILDTRFACSAFQLTPSEQNTEGSGCSLWRTPDANMASGGAANGEDRLAQGHAMGLHDQARTPKLWPTPSASDMNSPRPLDRRDPCDDNLPTRIQRLWPTTTERNWKSASHGNQDNARPLSEAAGLTGQGSLSPGFVEWLQGFPPGWTELQCPIRSPKNEFPIDHTDLKR